jgi:hypothetical protein
MECSSLRVDDTLFPAGCSWNDYGKAALCWVGLSPKSETRAQARASWGTSEWTLRRFAKSL